MRRISSRLRPEYEHGAMLEAIVRAVLDVAT
jgi:hypothetical protein